jgi:hypothetical protein
MGASPVAEEASNPDEATAVGGRPVESGISGIKKLRQGYRDTGIPGSGAALPDAA